jgi:glycosyltransferase involved in cell wall biosynthesis
MTALGHEVVLIIPRADHFTSDSAAYQEAERIFGSPLGFRVKFIRRITLFGRLQTLGSLWGARQALKEERPDLIYTRAPWACTFLPSMRIPFVYEIHMINLHEEIDWIDRILRRLVVRASRSAACKKVVAISAALAQVWQDFGVPKVKLLVAHDAVDPVLFPGTLTKQESRARLGLSEAPGRPLVVYAGALFDDGRFEQILECATRLSEIEFYIVGGARNDLERCREQLARTTLTNLHLIGLVPHHEVPVWLGAADILLMMTTWKYPTVRVFSPMKLFEYMTAERLIVCSAFPTILEVMTDGENALLFEPDNVDAMTATIAKAATLIDQTSMPGNAKTLVFDRYTWRERCRLILDGATGQSGSSPQPDKGGR